MLYEVAWLIEVEASSPIEAAEEARRIVRDTDTRYAGTFNVEDAHGQTFEVDLDAEKGPEVQSRCRACLDRPGKDSRGRRCRPCEGTGWAR